MDTWTYPTTWKVGDTLDADTLNARIRDQNKILLKRPLTVMTMSADQTVPVSGSGNYVLQWDTIVNDDDGMVIEDTPMSDFYAHRAGTYQVWLNVGFNGLSAADTVMACATVNGSARRWDNQYRMEAFSGVFFPLSTSGLIFLKVGEFIEFQAWNGSGSSTVTIPGGLNNTPRAAIMWLGPT